VRTFCLHDELTDLELTGNQHLFDAVGDSGMCKGAFDLDPDSLADHHHGWVNISIRYAKTAVQIAYGLLNRIGHNALRLELDCERIADTASSLLFSDHCSQLCDRASPLDCQNTLLIA